MISPSATIQREVANVDHVYERYEEVVDRLPAFIQRFADSLTTAVFSPEHRASAPLTVAAVEVGQLGEIFNLRSVHKLSIIYTNEIIVVV